MSDMPPPQLVNTTNELARERNRAAAERTLNAWTGICLSLIGFGVAFDQIGRSLRRQATVTTATPALVGIGFVGVGVLLLGLALVQHRLALSAIEQQNYVLLPIQTLNRWAMVTVVLAGVAGLGVTLLWR
jgi:putative membrane protein